MTTADTTRSSVLVAAGIALSRISGLVREVAVAGVLGTSIAAEALRTAFLIPKLLQNMLGEGALSASFIPVYSRLLEDNREDEAASVARSVAGLLAFATSVIVALAMVLPSLIVTLIAPGYADRTDGVFELTVDLLPIMAAGTGFVVLSAWCLGVLNAHRRFFLSYAAPVIWNMVQIVAVITAWRLAWTNDSIARAAAIGVLVGGLAQFAIQLPSVYQLLGTLRPRLAFDSGTRSVTRRFGPAVLGRGVIQIGSYLDIWLASLLAAGAVAVLSFAQVLYLLPVSLFAVAIAAAELPELSRTTSAESIRERMISAADRVSFWITGSLVLFIFGGRAIVGTLFQRGAFGPDDTVVVWLVLIGYSLGMLPTSLSRLSQNAAFSQGDTKGPALIAGVRVAVAGVLGAALMVQFDTVLITASGSDALRTASLPASAFAAQAAEEAGLLRLGAVGLALGSAVGAWLEYFLLQHRLRGSLGIVPLLAPSARRLLVPALVGTAATAAASLLAASLPVLGQGPAVVLTGGSIYVLVAAATGVPEARSLVDRLSRRA